jgi:hypothetical protein
MIASRRKSFKATWARIVMLAVFSTLPAFGNTSTVTNTSDSGAGSLRAAIAGASSGDTINFSVTGTITLTSGELLINQNLTISGPGASSLAISGNSASRVFEIASGTSVAISGLTIQNGNTPIGGGIYNHGGTLILTNSTLSLNSADYGGGIYNGGGTLNVSNSSLLGNSAAVYGGGIANDTGTVTLTNSTLSSNSALRGGAIVNTNSGTLNVTNSSFSANSGSQLGGGIWNTVGGTLNVTNSTLSGNSSNGGYGGGIYNGSSTLTVTNSTLSGNAASSGGGIVNDIGTFLVKNTILANSSSGGNCFENTGSTNTSQGHNLSDDATCSSFFTQAGDLNSTPAGLDPNGLQNNGGLTQTIALLATSPAVEAIPLTPTNYCTDVNGAPVTTDQRGVTRPQQGSACDIGAYELIPDNDSQFSQLKGGNTFTGNQNVNGNVNATNFVGNGSGLTGVITGVTAIAGLTGGGTSGNVSLGLASATCGAGSAVTAHPFTCTAFPTFGANTFTGTQAMPSLTAGSINSGVGIFSANNAVALAGVSNSSYGVAGNSTSGVGVGGASNSSYGVAGNSTSGVGVGGASINFYGVYGVSNGGTGVYGTTASTSATTAAAVFNNAATGNAGNILLGQSGQVTKFSVDSKGDVAASGSVTIGGGTPILEHLSKMFAVSVAGGIGPGGCLTLPTIAFVGASDGDTIALGIPNALVAGTAGDFLEYFAWVSAANTVSVRVCNLKGTSGNNFASGQIRVDIWKH